MKCLETNASKKGIFNERSDPLDHYTIFLRLYNKHFLQMYGT